MILAVLIGLALQSWAGWSDAMIHGLLLGMLVAAFVPTAPRAGRTDSGDAER